MLKFVRSPWLGVLMSAAWLLIGLGSVVQAWQASSWSTWLESVGLVALLTLASRYFVLPAIQWAPRIAAVLGLGSAVAVVAVVRASHWSRGLHLENFWTPGLCLLLIATVRYTRRGAVRQVSVVRLRWPLDRGGWVVAEGETKAFNHHWVAPTQRAALDLVGIGGLRSLLHGDYRSFGVPLSSPCDGVVVTARDGIPDGVSDTRRPAGNHVVIRAGEELVLLAHLRRSTVAVTEGQQVWTGDRIGDVGHSGNSSEPHLHLHVQTVDNQPLRPVFDGLHGPFRRGDVMHGRRALRTEPKQG